MSGVAMVNVGYKQAAAGPVAVLNLDAATYSGLSASFNGSSQYFDIASTAAFGFGTDTGRTCRIQNKIWLLNIYG